MFHTLKYYITPLITATIIVGILLGGHWMWLGFITLCIIIIGGDAFLGDDESTPLYSHSWFVELPLHLALPLIFLLLLSLAWAGGKGGEDFLGLGKMLSNIFHYSFLEARNQNIGTDYLGAVLGVGFMVAGYGTNVGHELTHRIKNKIAMIEGRWLLSASCNADFSIEHVFGHHVTVGTDADPATAHKGENVYSFFIRSFVFGHINAWRIELKRLKRKNNRLFSLHNQMITGYSMSFSWSMIFILSSGWFGLVLFFSQAILAKFILEIVNYMEHYGLKRDPKTPVGPEHSWNTNRRMSGIILFSLTRHSAHHEKPRVPFWELDPYPDAPQMPFGYLTTLFICLIPPLWMKIISKPLEIWENQYSVE
ncbi:MAG: alkane 1-monooxygenase [Candidatus Marinimicrobia bacterium]|nr:alkane 1-monooxygenase [Candidatus Neomarinimicrobiota bacterium]